MRKALAGELRGLFLDKMSEQCSARLQMKKE